MQKTLEKSRKLETKLLRHMLHPHSKKEIEESARIGQLKGEVKRLEHKLEKKEEKRENLAMWLKATSEATEIEYKECLDEIEKILE